MQCKLLIVHIFGSGNLRRSRHRKKRKSKWRRSLRWSVWLLLLISLILSLQGSSSQIQSNNNLQHTFKFSDNFGNEPWANLIGLRMVKLRSRLPTVDRVVLVPDRATFLKALQTWNLQGRFPILMDDSQYAPMFIRRFQPAEVIRLPSVNALPAAEKRITSEGDLLDTVAKTWGVPEYKLLANHWQKLGWIPAGVVITSLNDPAAPAAVALAAAWGQPLTFLDTDFGQPNDSLEFSRWQILRSAVEDKIAQTGYGYKKLGDAIDTITIARQMAVKYRPAVKAKEDFAVTDGLARNPDRSRWAIAGWIFGSLERSIYQAMCSIFLDYQTALMFDTYTNESPWYFYALKPAAAKLEKVGIKTKLFATPNAELKQWRESDRLASDLLFVNSSGSPSAFTVNGSEAQVPDIPKWQTPTAIHFIHSWSAVTPDDAQTIAGRWLANGAYAYVGSVNEPYLQAFVPPSTIVSRLLDAVPFLVAARQYQSSPWKVTAIGDPLMLITPPRQRISPKDLPYPTP
ncbi:hypothetical protein H6F42_13825 [Pseudanabaena sp. FACHB-1998]|uniref:hypothetical protein n=1 Tax=Pseudanabaena sp. FACHB-1998 TaxID=2692858 RepID=UPI001680D821|nr:hypothetical protein [Pseudanabaena sp. FACHB-1998]MBD2177995.1 hypothetical protein [Pseudanabaena sp. FACHB-1998]